MNLNPEERAVGQENYHTAVGAYYSSEAAAAQGRRDFLKTVVGAGIVSGAGLGAKYFWKEEKPLSDPLRVAVIGTGDEGGVLIGAMNPNYVNCVAICDIRPYNVHRAFHGDWTNDTAVAARPGLIKVFGHASEAEAKKKTKVYTQLRDVLNDKDVEAIIIALPLHLHAPVAVQAMLAGKHVLTEKLMAHNVAQCKVMGRVAETEKKYLAVGHQRHYSVLYDNAVNLLKWGVLGEIHHIRAQWHRGNLPGSDSWQPPLPGGEEGVDSQGAKTIVDRIGAELAGYKKMLSSEKDPVIAALLEKKVAQWEAWTKDKEVNASNHGYQTVKLGDGRTRSPLEELVRWRLFQRTGGGLMAELGSHQLDAASIFCSALRKDGKKAHPLTVHAVGGRHTFPLDREAEDHVYCMFEFPGPGYDDGFKPGYYDKAMNYPDPAKGIPAYDVDPNKKIVVTYSSINGNGFGGYGEIVMGTKGTLALEREQEVLLYKNSDTTTKIGVKDEKGGPVLDTQASGKGPALAKAAENQGPVSRGYREEIEHFAYCVRNQRDPKELRCRAEVALGDAVIALTTNVALKNANDPAKQKDGPGGFIRFQDEWYDIHHDATPDGSSVKQEDETLRTWKA